MSDTIALTGATGFLGSHVAASLLARGHRLVLLKRSTSDLSRLDALGVTGRRDGTVSYHDLDRAPLDAALDNRGVRLVLHCATSYASDYADAARVVESNVVFPLNLVECCRRHGVPRFVNVDTLIRGPVSPYALSKKHFSEWLAAIADPGLRVGNVLLEHFYGPGDSPQKFVPSIVRALLQNQPRIALTPGMQLRDFIYISDAVDAVVRVIDSTLATPAEYEEYEIGSGVSCTIRQFVELIQSLTGSTKTTLDFGAIPYRKHEIMNMRVDMRKLAALGWSPSVSLAEGVRLTIADAARNISTPTTPGESS